MVSYRNLAAVLGLVGFFIQLCSSINHSGIVMFCVDDRGKMLVPNAAWNLRKLNAEKDDQYEDNLHQGLLQLEDEEEDAVTTPDKMADHHKGRQANFQNFFISNFRIDIFQFASFGFPIRGRSHST